MEQLGIEPKLLIAQLVNFAIIVFVLQKLLYKPILDMLNKRKKEIAEGLAITERMKAEEEKFNEKQEKALAKAREDAMGIIEDAKKQAKEVEKELVADAHTQAAAIITRAKAEAAETHTAAQTSLRKEAIALATTMAKRLLSSVLTAKEQHAYIEKRVKDLESWAKEL